MNKFLSFALTFVLAVLAAVGLTTYGIVSGAIPTTDKAKVAEIAQSVTFPQYNNVDDFLVDAQEDAKFAKAPDLVLKLHPNTVAAIAAKLIKKNGTFNYCTFVDEYEMSKDTYDAMDRVNTGEAAPSQQSIDEYAALDASKDTPPNSTDSVANKKSNKSITVTVSNGD